ncbi:hypothetical protein Aperf_G00000119898 [Anoplocephala perfoliata]
MPYCFHERNIFLLHINLEDDASSAVRLAGTGSVVGLLFGMIVGLNVAISDLGSELFESLYQVKASPTVRRGVLFFILLIILPFCCVRRSEFLSISSLLAVVLYLLFFLDLFTTYTIPKIQSEPFSLRYFRFWRPQGLIHCVPIIASSVCCQTQVNSVYSNMKNPSMADMKKILVSSVAFIFSCYLFVGLMGYIAFYRGPGAPMVGDILAMYPEDNQAAYIRLGFLYTVTASVPLLLFPLRAALHSLLFEEVFSDEGVLTVDDRPIIPDARFFEVILSFTGGLAGGASCYLLPAVIGARTLGLRKRPFEMPLLILLLSGLGFLVLLTPIFTFFVVDA